MQKAVAFKILNIYTFTLNSLHTQLSSGQPQYICMNPQLLCTKHNVAKMHRARHPQMKNKSFKRLPLNLAEGSNSSSH